MTSLNEQMGDFQGFLRTPPEFLRETFINHERTYGRRDLEREVRRMFNSLGVDTS